MQTKGIWKRVDPLLCRLEESHCAKDGLPAYKIADYVGCNWRMIARVEKRAIAKISRELKKIIGMNRSSVR